MRVTGEAKCFDFGRFYFCGWPFLSAWRAVAEISGWMRCMPSAVSPVTVGLTVERKSTGQIRRIISNGRGMMPAFSPALRPVQISDMVSMVRFLSREGRAVSWWEKYDTLVVAHCSVPWDAVFGSDETEEKKR